jgi:hypothetical protein
MLTGEGLGVAFGAAGLLVNCVIGERPADYDRQWRQMTRRYRMLTAALLQASSRATLRSSIVPAAVALPTTPLPPALAPAATAPGAVLARHPQDQSAVPGARCENELFGTRKLINKTRLYTVQSECSCVTTILETLSLSSLSLAL